MAEQIFKAYPEGSGFYRNRKTGFESSYYKKKEMDTLYPAGGFSVCGQVGEGRNILGECVSGEATEKVYRTSKMPHAVIKGYIRVGENDFIAVVSDVLFLWIILILLLLALLAAAGFFIHHAVTASGPAEPPTTNAPGVVDPNAQLGEGEISVPDKIDTKQREIKINGIPLMKLKAGTVEQNFIFSNPESNPCYFQIEIILEDTGEVIYTSNLLPPGYSISKFNLKRPLDAGEYKATVKFNCLSFDKEQRKLNGGVVKTTIEAS